jgi:hypothetical protein
MIVYLFLFYIYFLCYALIFFLDFPLFLAMFHFYFIFYCLVSHYIFYEYFFILLHFIWSFHLLLCFPLFVFLLFTFLFFFPNKRLSLWNHRNIYFDHKIFLIYANLLYDISIPYLLNPFLFHEHFYVTYKHLLYNWWQQLYSLNVIRWDSKHRVMQQEKFSSQEWLDSLYQTPRD